MALALTGSLLRPRYQPLVPSRSGRNELSAARFRLVVVAGTGSARERRPQNVEGNFFVDHTCIDCDTCRWMAPDVFARIDGMSAVTKQPASKDENVKGLQALLSCPTNSIRTEKPMKEVVEVNKMFPLPIDEIDIPGVYHCGYHSEKSYGATSYFISHPEGNIMVDCPKYKEILARQIDMLGGVRYLFLTHKDDIGEHDKWARRFKCDRIMHVGDVDYRTEDVERKLHGNGPWTIGSDFELVHTPGHTEGSVCLYYRAMKVLFTGDHLYRSSETGKLDISIRYNQQSVSLQLDSVKKLLDFDFNWILPGHGRRIRFKDNYEKNSAIEAFLATKEHLHDNSNNRNKEPLFA
ncbi:metallo-beta-lactamase family protein isoform X1 [Carex rostrata]